MAGEARRIHVARQPILDGEGRVAGYELLYRASAEASKAEFPDTRTACLRTLVGAFVDLGADTLLGSRTGFLNVAPEVIRTDLVEALPKDRVVLEILETDVADRALRARCRELRKRGFRLALDDYVPGDEREALLADVDTVKIDLARTHPRSLRPLVHSLRRHPVTLLAEKVETAEQQEQCRRAGFDLYQGYFFARPRTLSGASVDPARTAILDLIAQLSGEVDLDRVEETLKHHVSLGVNLLRLVNSVALARADKIATVRQALVLLGQHQLRRWLTMLLYAGGDPRGVSSPLLETAAVRGRLMELLATQLARARGAPRPAAEAERAFLAGMLSLVDALLDAPMDRILEQIRVEDTITGAVLRREGEMGELLIVAEALERGEFDAVTERLARHAISADQLLQAEMDAYRWVAGVDRAGDETA